MKNSTDFSLREKILFVISVIFLTNAVTLPLGIAIIVWIFVKKFSKTIEKDSEISTDFVN